MVPQPHFTTYPPSVHGSTKTKTSRTCERIFRGIFSSIGSAQPKTLGKTSYFDVRSKLLPEIGAALAGDRFDSLQEAINKAQVVEEKRIRRDADPSFAFLQGIEPSNKHSSFESTTSEIFKVPTIATVTQAPTKRKLEEALEELTSTLKSNTESFNVLSKQFANKFNEEGANFPVINIIDQNPSRRVQFSQPFQPSKTIQRYVKDTLT